MEDERVLEQPCDGLEQVGRGNYGHVGHLSVSLLERHVLILNFDVAEVADQVGQCEVNRQQQCARVELWHGCSVYSRNIALVAKAEGRLDGGAGQVREERVYTCFCDIVEQLRHSRSDILL